MNEKKIIDVTGAELKPGDPDMCIAPAVVTRFPIVGFVPSAEIRSTKVTNSAASAEPK